MQRIFTRNPLPYILVGLILLILNSCEYDSDENNYHNILPPEENIKVEIDLAGANPKDIIYIYSNTDLYYTVNTSSGNIIAKQFYLENVLLPIYDNNNIRIIPNIYDDQTRTLKLKMKMTSGTGSLLEILGGEKYEAEIEYKLKYVRSDSNLEIKQRTTTEGKLELYWEKPQIGDLSIGGYDIYYYNEFNEILKQHISDPNQTSFIDENYVYGNRTYRIVTTFQPSKIEPWETFYTAEYTSIAHKDFSYETETNNQLKIKWNNNNKFASKYVLVWDNQKITTQQGISEAYITRPEFPLRETKYYKLYILPSNADYNDYLKYPEIVNYFEEPFVGDFHTDTSGSLIYAADLKNSKILTIRSSYGGYPLQVYNFDDLKTFTPYPLLQSDNYYAENIFTSPNTGIVAIHYRNNNYNVSPKICVYSDYTLKTVLSTFLTDSWPVCFLTDDDKIIIRNDRDKRTNHIYNIKTGKLLNSQKDTEDTEFRSAISANGKYIFNYLRIDNMWYKLYQYENGSFNLLKYQRNSKVTNIVFHPIKENQVIMENGDTSFSIYEIPSLNKLKTIEGKFINIDPFTGNIIYQDKNFMQNHRMNILNATYEKEIFNFTQDHNLSYLHTLLINNQVKVYDYYFKIKN